MFLLYVVALTVSSFRLLLDGANTFHRTQAAFQNVLAVRLLLHLRTVNEEADPVSRDNISSMYIKHTTEASEFSTLEAAS